MSKSIVNHMILFANDCIMVLKNESEINESLINVMTWLRSNNLLLDFEKNSNNEFQAERQLRSHK